MNATHGKSLKVCFLPDSSLVYGKTERFSARKRKGRVALVMAGLVPAIHDFGLSGSKTWMPATSAGVGLRSR